MKQDKPLNLTIKFKYAKEPMICWSIKLGSLLKTSYLILTSLQLPQVSLNTTTMLLISLKELKSSENNAKVVIYQVAYLISHFHSEVLKT